MIYTINSDKVEINNSQVFVNGALAGEFSQNDEGFTAVTKGQTRQFNTHAQAEGFIVRNFRRAASVAAVVVVVLASLPSVAAVQHTDSCRRDLIECKDSE